MSVARIETCAHTHPGRTTAVDLTPDKAGTFPYYCCLETGAAAETERGRLVVAE